MSSTPHTHSLTAAPRVRRVRHQARESAAVMAFSLATSVGLSLALLLLLSLGR